MKLRKLIFKIVEPSHKRDLSHAFDILIIVLIILSIADIILESVPSLDSKYSIYFQFFETFSVVIFTVEYILRVWTCVEIFKYRKPFSGRLRFMLSPMALVDLLAVLPFYLPFIGIDLRFLRALRLFRIFRILKMARYTKAITHIKNVLVDKREELLVTMSFFLIVLLIISTLMYYLEREVQPENFSSIPKALWWGIVTLTTVGYGDVYPITPLGKILGGIITFLSVGLIALPSGILASGYTEQIAKTRESNKDKEKDKS